MKARRDRLERALVVSQSLWRLELTRLGQIETKLNALRAAEQRTLAALEQGLIDPRLTLAQLSQFGAARREAEAAHARQIESARGYGRRAKQTQRLFEKADAIWRRERVALQMRALSDQPDVSAP